MNSRVSWSVDGIDPSVRERAEAAARHAGMSLNDWLNSTIADSIPPNFRASPDQWPDMSSQETREIADIHQRLDAITRQIEQISRPAPRNDALRSEPGVARQLNDAIARLDARLSQISNPAPAKQARLQDKQRQADMVEHAAAQIYRPSPPLSPSLDFAVAEIAARQNELENAAPRPMPPPSAPPMAPAMPAGPDFSTLERHLLEITSQIAALQRPDGIEQSIAAFRGELAEIRHAITEAMPRRAIESIENEIRSLSRRIDDNRQSGIDGQALAGIERALGEIREVLRSLTPAEQLAGYDEAIRNLGAKLDLILRANDDPSTVRQLEGAIAALRAIVSNVASNDALARLSDDVRTLSSRVDQAARSGDNSDSFAILGQRIAALTSTLESRERPAADESSEQLEVAVRALSDRLDRIPVGNDSASAFANDALARLSDDVRTLSSRVDQAARSGDNSDSFAILGQRIAALTSTLESRGRPAADESSEQLEVAVRALSDRLDRILVGNDSASAFANDALARLSDDVRTLSSRVDQAARSGDNSDSFAILGQRIAALTSTLESRERPAADESSEQLEVAVRALSDRLDRIPVGNDGASAFAHLEQRVSYLLERLEASADHRAGHLGRVEDGLHDILRHLETQHASFAALAENGRSAAEPSDSGLIDLVKRELSDIRFNQTETHRDTQNSLETVHNSLGHVVDRLAMIEGDLGAARSPAVAPQPAPQPAPPQASPQQTAAPRLDMAPPPKPELPNPAAAQPQFATAPREFHAAQPPMPAVATVPTRAITEILEPHTAQPRTAIAPVLPPDHPLEPGTRPAGRMASPSERIAASESAISEIPAGVREPPSASSFIAAARRAAQAAAAAPPGDKAGRSPKGSAGNKEPSTITSKIRSLLVGASVVVIVLSAFKMTMTLLDGGSVLPLPFMENSSEPSPSAQSPADAGAKPAMPDPAPPSVTPPTPTDRQSLNNSAPNAADSTASVPIPQTADMSPAAPVSAGDITGTIPSSAAAPIIRKLTIVQIPPTERLPDAIGGPALRAAALWGDPTAAYEIGVRFAEGKGVATNFDEAAKWYDRAAQAGLVPAIFRLGTFYEKGLSVNKDVEIARRYYLQAAEQGSAKAMHNLAVLDADGGGKGANYKSASQWFRKAADRGVADSQFNLGILYARGIGVEQNLAESFKWFSLAAAQGDADSARKRDDIAKRLDPQSLAAARLAIQTFTPEPQPDDAINVASPAGGWDSAPAQASTAKPAAKPVSIKRAAR